MENRHKNIRLYVAKTLVQNENKFIDVEDFDLSILRTRNIERYTKELVKKKLTHQLRQIRFVSKVFRGPQRAFLWTN